LTTAVTSRLVSGVTTIGLRKERARSAPLPRRHDFCSGTAGHRRSMVTKPMAKAPSKSAGQRTSRSDMLPPTMSATGSAIHRLKQ
jgi:hypothetical protein